VQTALFFCWIRSFNFEYICLKGVRGSCCVCFVLIMRYSVLWHCWLGIRESTRPVKIEWWGVGVVICLERGPRLFACGPAGATAIPSPRHLLRHLNPDWFYLFLPSVLWRCWLGGRKGIRPVKNFEWCSTGVVICLERDADLYMAQLMPLPLSGTGSPG